MTTKEKLLALELLGHARQVAASIQESINVESVLLLAAEYAKNGADLSILKTLEYK